MLVEVELDLLVGNVDAQLLERVPLEVLKAENIQDADVQALVLLSGGGGNRKSASLEGFNCLSAPTFTLSNPQT